MLLLRRGLLMTRHPTVVASSVLKCVRISTSTLTTLRRHRPDAFSISSTIAVRRNLCTTIPPGNTAGTTPGVRPAGTDGLFGRGSSFTKVTTQVYNPATLASGLHVPPLAVRVGIVATSVGLGTPFFAVGAMIRLWYSYLPRSQFGRLFLWTSYVAGGGGFIHLMINFVIPFMRNHSDFVLPFALANAVASGLWYTVGEVTLGLPFMSGAVALESLQRSAFGMGILAILRVMGQNVAGGTGTVFATSLPIGGIFVGGLTALTAPFLWPLMFKLCWDTNTNKLLVGDDPTWLVDLYQYIALPMGLPVGLLAGIGLHLAVKPFIVGKVGTPWTQWSFPMLALVSALGLVYFTLFKDDMFEEFMWMGRLDVATGEYLSVNPVDGVVVRDDAHRAAKAEVRRAFARAFQALRDPLRAIGYRGWGGGMEGSMNDAYRESRYKSMNKDKSNQNKRDRHGDTSNDARTHSIKGKTIDGGNVALCTTVYRVIDQLVRLQYLTQEKNSRGRTRPGNSIDDDVDALITCAKNDGIHDLKALQKSVETAIIARRVLAVQERAEDRIGATTARELLIEAQNEIIDCGVPPEVKNQVYFFSAPPPPPPDHYGLRLLISNLDVLEDELEEKIGYKIAQSKAAENKLLTDYHAEIVHRKRRVSWGTLAVFGLAFTLVVAVGTSMKNH